MSLRACTGGLPVHADVSSACSRLRALDAASIAKAAEMNDPALAELDPMLSHLVGG